MGTKVESQTKKDVPYLTTIISWVLFTILFNSIPSRKMHVSMNNNNLIFYFSRLSHLIVHRILRPWYHPDWMWQISAPGRKAAQCTRTLIQFTNKLIAERKKLLAEKSVQSSDNSSLDADDDDVGSSKYTFLKFLKLSWPNYTLINRLSLIVQKNLDWLSWICYWKCKKRMERVFTQTLKWGMRQIYSWSL